MAVEQADADKAAFEAALLAAADTTEVQAAAAAAAARAAGAAAARAAAAATHPAPGTAQVGRRAHAVGAVLTGVAAAPIAARIQVKPANVASAHSSATRSSEAALESNARPTLTRVGNDSVVEAADHRRDAHAEGKRPIEQSNSSADAEGRGAKRRRMEAGSDVSASSADDGSSPSLDRQRPAEEPPAPSSKLLASRPAAATTRKPLPPPPFASAVKQQQHTPATSGEQLKVGLVDYDDEEADGDA